MLSTRKIRYSILTMILSILAISTYTSAESIISATTRAKLLSLSDPRFIAAMLTHPGIATTTPVAFRVGTCQQSSLRDDSKYLLQVVNEVNALPSSYVPKYLVDVRPHVMTAGNLQVCVTKTTASQLYLMIKDMQKEGMNLMLVSGYRSYRDQNTLYRTEGKILNSGTYERVALAGQSEHQLGTSVDVASMTSSGTSFGTTTESAWLHANASKYGFILSYDKDHEEQTGYMYEPWHLRYVGAENALLLNEGDYALSYKPQYYSYARMNALLMKLKEFIQP